MEPGWGEEMRTKRQEDEELREWLKETPGRAKGKEGCRGLCVAQFFCSLGDLQ